MAFCRGAIFVRSNISGQLTYRIKTALAELPSPNRALIPEQSGLGP